MATQARSLSVPLSGTNLRQPPQGLISRIVALLVQPGTFFRHLPQKRQWVVVAVLVLIVTGYAASNQTESTSTTRSSNSAQGFDISLMQPDAPSQSSDQAQLLFPTAQTTSSSTDDTNTVWMSALLTACGVLATWAGQAVLLGLVTMLRGYPPHLKRNFQIAIWASLPLALMLLMRQVYFAAGGTGGTTGLALLLDQWDGYSALPDAAQRVLAVFASNLSLFWLWNLALLYLGARHALEGKRWTVILALAMWVTLSTVIPAFTSDPVTTIAPRTTTATTTEQSSTDSSSRTTTTSTIQQFGGGMMPSGGNFSGGSPPSGGGPGGGGPPGG